LTIAPLVKELIIAPLAAMDCLEKIKEDKALMFEMISCFL